MRRPIRRRTRFFVCVTGPGDQSLVQWWQRLSDQENLHIHLDVHVRHGGDNRSVVEHAVDRLQRQAGSHVTPKSALVLLDADTMAQDRRSGRDPTTAKGSEQLQLIYLRPNLEGLLLRLCPGCESRFVAPQLALSQLRTAWPEYVKPMPARALGRRFGIDDLRRAARHDDDLRQVLATIGLIRSV